MLFSDVAIHIYLLFYISPLDPGQHNEYFTNAGSEYGLFVDINMTFAQYFGVQEVRYGLQVSDK